MLAVVIAEGAAILLLAVLVVGLLRSHALILRALHELGAGLELEDDAADASAAGPQPLTLEKGVVPGRNSDRAVAAADITGIGLDGSPAGVPVSSTGNRTLLAFLTSGCSVCATFWDEFRTGGHVVPGAARLQVVVKDAAEESPAAVRSLAGDDLDVVASSAAWTDYEIPGSPYFVLVADGRVAGEGSATTWTQVRDLMQQGVDEAAAAATDRDSVPRIDAELEAAGITPGHPSLFVQPDAAEATAESATGDDGTR